MQRPCSLELPLHPGERRGTSLVLALVLVFLSFVAYLPALDLPFLEYDDDTYVTANAHLKEGSIGEFLAWALTSVDYAANWHPVTWLSYWTDLRLFGLAPWGFHLVNVILHSGTTALLFLAWRGLTGALWRSLGIAVLWGLHPLGVESVARVAERKGLLCGVFWFLALGAYARYARRPTVSSYFLVVAFFSLGLMAKPVMITFPFVLFLLDYWPLGRVAGRPGRIAGPETGRPAAARLARIVLEKVPLLALSALASVLTYVAQERGAMMETWQKFSLPERLGNAVHSYLDYARTVVWPEGLSPLYPHPGSSLQLQEVFLAAAALVALSAAGFLLRNRTPWAVVGWAWFLGTLVPVIGLIQVGVQARADRYAYLPMVGLLIVGVWGAEALAGRRAKVVGALAAGLICCAAGLAWASRGQIGFWSSDLALYRRALSVTSANWLAEYNVGVYLERAGQDQEAMRHYERSVRIFDGDPLAHSNLGVLLVREGRLDEAIEHYRRALQYDADSAAIRYNLGNALMRKGRLLEAKQEYEQVIRILPSHFGGLTNHGSVSYQLRLFEEAAGSFDAAARLRPEDAAARHNLGLALEAAGRYEQALAEVLEALRLRPDYREARMSLARLKVLGGGLRRERADSP